MQSRAFRSALAGKPKRLSLRQTAKIIGAKKSSKRALEKSQFLKSEPDLIPKLGKGSYFVLKIYRRFQHQFELLDHDIKRCSAHLNIVENNRMLDGCLWSDKAVESMFRRAMPKGKKRQCSKKS
jgi:hypothetical protein